MTLNKCVSEYNYDNAPTNPHHGGKMTPTDMSRRIEELEEELQNAVDLLERLVTKMEGQDDAGYQYV